MTLLVLVGKVIWPSHQCYNQKYSQTQTRDTNFYSTKLNRLTDTYCVTKKKTQIHRHTHAQTHIHRQTHTHTHTHAQTHTRTDRQRHTDTDISVFYIMIKEEPPVFPGQKPSRILMLDIVV